MAATSPLLPADSEAQAYVVVKPIVAGVIQLPLNIVFVDRHEDPDSHAVPVPAFSFLITHPTQGHHLFDIGIRKNCEGYPPSQFHRVHNYFKAQCHEDVADQLRKGGVQPEDIKTIILSHLHWDHIGDPACFPSANLVLAAGSKGLLSAKVYPANPDGGIQEFPPDMLVEFVDFDSPSPYKLIAPFATFKRAIDFFGDGTLYLVDTPGHVSGHMSAVVRVGPGAFMFLGGDICHHREGYAPGTRLISERMHEDIATSRDSIQRLAKLYAETPGLVVVIAHEAGKVEEGLPLFPNDVRDWVVQQVEKRNSSE